MEIFSTKEIQFYVIIRKNEVIASDFKGYYRHYTYESAVKECKRLARRYKDTFFILQTVEAHRDVPKTMQVSLQELNFEPKDVKLKEDPLRYY